MPLWKKSKQAVVSPAEDGIKVSKLAATLLASICQASIPLMLLNLWAADFRFIRSYKNWE